MTSVMPKAAHRSSMIPNRTATGLNLFVGGRGTYSVSGGGNWNGTGTGRGTSRTPRPVPWRTNGSRRSTGGFTLATGWTNAGTASDFSHSCRRSPFVLSSGTPAFASPLPLVPKLLFGRNEHLPRNSVSRPCKSWQDRRETGVPRVRSQTGVWERGPQRLTAPIARPSATRSAPPLCRLPASD